MCVSWVRAAAGFLCLCHIALWVVCALSLWGCSGMGCEDRVARNMVHASRTLETVDQSFVISRLHGCVHDSVAACVSDK